MLKKAFLTFLFFLTLTFVTPILAQEQKSTEASGSVGMIIPVQEYNKAQVIKVLEEGELEIYGSKQLFQKLEVQILNGREKGKIEIIEHGKKTKLRDDQKVYPPDIVVLYKGGLADNLDQYQIIDKYRLNNIFYLAIAFFIFVLAVGRLQGLGSIIGLAISFFVIIKYIVPQILAGGDPLLVSIIGSSVILLTSIYFSHGFSFKTSIAIFSTIVTLIITGLLAIFAVKTSSLTGLGNETAYGLNFNPSLANLNLRGLMLGGIIIGALGVLDDVTTTQSSTVFELKKANPDFSFKDLMSRGFKVGKDHISAVVNTLILAYTGASLPILILIILNPSAQPLWLMLNSETITEEIIRTLVGSFGLVLSVPITTTIAAWIATKGGRG